MVTPIIERTDPVTLVGAGQVSPGDLDISLRLAPTCVAADGGARAAIAHGAAPAAVIGDFDSLDAETLAQVPQARRHRIAEQDSTDFEKALSRIAAPLVIGVGFLGGRLDHQLAVLHGLVACADRPCLLLGREETICLVPPELSLPLAPRTPVSVFPLAAVRAQSRGLRWPLDGLDLAPGRRIGTSNRATGPLWLRVDAPGLLLILPRAVTPGLVSALSSPPAARWSARAG